jgi:hypothetical protein
MSGISIYTATFPKFSGMESFGAIHLTVLPLQVIDNNSCLVCGDDNIVTIDVYVTRDGSHVTQVYG